MKLIGIEPILVPYQNTILTNWIIVSILLLELMRIELISIACNTIILPI